MHSKMDQNANHICLAVFCFFCFYLKMMSKKWSQSLLNWICNFHRVRMANKLLTMTRLLGTWARVSLKSYHFQVKFDDSVEKISQVFSPHEHLLSAKIMDFSSKMSRYIEIFFSIVCLKMIRWKPTIC